jgi:predicted transcriptional regulator
MEHTPEYDLIERIKDFIAETGMTPSEFGKKAVNDGNLFKQLNEGRELRRRTREKVFSFIGSHSKEVPDVSCLNSIVSENETKVNRGAA